MRCCCCCVTDSRDDGLWRCSTSDMVVLEDARRRTDSQITTYSQQLSNCSVRDSASSQHSYNNINNHLNQNTSTSFSTAENGNDSHDEEEEDISLGGSMSNADASDPDTPGSREEDSPEHRERRDSGVGSSLTRAPRSVLYPIVQELESPIDLNFILQSNRFHLSVEVSIYKNLLRNSILQIFFVTVILEQLEFTWSLFCDTLFSSLR